MESPGRPSDLFAQGPPSSKELAAAKHCLEGLLSATEEEDMGPAPADLPVSAAATAAVQPAAAVPAAGVSGPAKAAGAAAAGKAGVGAAPSDSTAAAAVGQAVAAAAAGGDGSVLDWRSVSTWVKMEALLDEEDGLTAAGAEGAVAAWLAQLLPRMVCK
jgi:hypothetical protein